MQKEEYLIKNACYSVTKYYLCKQNNKRSLLGRKQRSQVARSFLNRYQLSCTNNVTSLFSIRYILIIILQRISENVAHGYGEVTSNGGGDLITIRGLCWGIEHNPTIGKAYVVAGAGLGAFDGNMTELLADQTYYVRAFAGNSKGVAYGNEMSFITRPSGTLPTVATTEIIQNGSTSLTIKGIVSDEGASAVVIKGICWGICPNPSYARQL